MTDIVTDEVLALKEDLGWWWGLQSSLQMCHSCGEAKGPGMIWCW